MIKWLTVGILCQIFVTISANGPQVSIEACPSDSMPVGDRCMCDTDTCTKPPCPGQLKVVSNGTDTPGSCCPLYSCEGCKTEDIIDGKCPCAANATINEKGICECIDKERHLINGKCVCNPLQCELPQVCDRKHVLITKNDGCCRKTKCELCPEGTESTSLDSDDLDDHCVCLPCPPNDCGQNTSVVVKRKGTGMPDNCCDLYECKPLDEQEKDCVVGDIIYANGETWLTAEKQKCECQNGISLCGAADNPLDCVDHSTIYKHFAVWIKENGCTVCNCNNGKTTCISESCGVKETKINENASLPCNSYGKIYEHQDIWIDERDNCTKCQCFNGVESCNSTLCQEKEIPERNECHPLSDCNKQCPNGFRTKKGCEICKCNPPRVTQLLSKYNISYDDLVSILDDHASLKRLTTTSTSTTTTTTLSPSVTLIKRHGEGLDQSSTETIITRLPEKDKADSILIPVTYSTIIGIIVGIIMGIFSTCIALYCRNKRTQSKDFTSDKGSYQPVHNNNNNNNV